jgi:hypothetical protein
VDFDPNMPSQHHLPFHVALENLPSRIGEAAKTASSHPIVAQLPPLFTADADSGETQLGKQVGNWSKHKKAVLFALLSF